VLQSAQRKVTSINVAVFGFSRGAAQARTFANWMEGLLTRGDGGGPTLAGVPFRLYFMGLFDTVASVGVPSLVPGFNGHMAWADGTQQIPALVEQCVHYIALHEQRAAFPLELAGDARQVVYPGMHADVGGGYLPTEQGKAGHLSQIPLNDMHYEAVKAGVPLLSREDMDERPTLKAQFEVSPALVDAYNAYWRDNGLGTGAGDVLRMQQQHTQQYVRWRHAAPAKADLCYRPFYQRASAADQEQLAQAQDDLAQQVSEVYRRLNVSTTQMIGDELFRGAMRAAIDDRPVSASVRGLYTMATEHADVPAAVVTLLDRYVHDSRAGFYVAGKLEPHDLTGGYLRYRTVYHNSREVAAVAAADTPAVPSGTRQGAVA
jgi:hypothetical protein